MEAIDVSKTDDTKEGWLFLVTVGDYKYKVELDSEYWIDITNKEINPEDLIHKSFEFLLDREPTDAILTSFNLREINNYFPEYEDEISKIR